MRGSIAHSGKQFPVIGKPLSPGGRKSGRANGLAGLQESSFLELCFTPAQSDERLDNMLDGLLSSIVNTCLTAAFSVAGVSGGLASGVGIPADLGQSPVAIVDTLIDSPLAGAEVFTAAGLPGIETFAVLATGDYENPTIVAADAYVPLTDNLYLIPGGQVPLMLANSTLNTIGATVGSVLSGLPVNILGGGSLL